MSEDKEDLGLRWAWPATAWSRGWVPSPWLRWVAVVKASDPTLDQWSVTRALALQLCRKELPQWRKVVKQVFSKRRKSTVYVERHRGRLRGRVPESHICGSLSYFYGVFLLGFLWPIILIFLDHSPYLVYLRILQSSDVCDESLSRIGFCQRGLWLAWY